MFDDAVALRVVRDAENMIVSNQSLNVVHKVILEPRTLIAENDGGYPVFTKVFIEQCLGGTAWWSDDHGVTAKILSNDQDILIVSGSAFALATFKHERSRRTVHSVIMRAFKLIPIQVDSISSSNL
jgi:hypothetical protein